MVSKSKNYFSPMLICWNDIKIHLGFEDSYFVPPPTLTFEIQILILSIKNNKHIFVMFAIFVHS